MSYQDEYWTVYYDKPYTFFHCYNIGLILGVAYFQYKYDGPDETSQIHKFFTNVKEQNPMAVMCMAAGLTIQFLTVSVDKYVNSRPEGISFAFNFIYLLLVRPMYVVGFCLFIIPLILQAHVTRSLRAFLGSKYWIPFSRLTFGVFLCNTVFI